jgi:hypothetical protein
MGGGTTGVTGVTFIYIQRNGEGQGLRYRYVRREELRVVELAFSSSDP